jgi:hypothetical protein
MLWSLLSFHPRAVNGFRIESFSRRPKIVADTFYAVHIKDASRSYTGGNEREALTIHLPTHVLRGALAMS